MSHKIHSFNEINRLAFKSDRLLGILTLNRLGPGWGSLWTCNLALENADFILSNISTTAAKNQMSRFQPIQKIAKAG